MPTLQIGSDKRCTNDHHHFGVLGIVRLLDKQAECLVTRTTLSIITQPVRPVH